MNIILVSTSVGGGGAQRAAVNLASYFAETGHEVTYFHWGAAEAYAYELSPSVRIVRSSGNSFLSRLTALSSLMRSLRPDVAYSFTDVPNILTFMAGWLGAKNCRIVLGVHSNLRRRDSQIRQGLLERTLRVMHKAACRHADAVVAVSDEACRSLIDYYDLPQALVHRIYNPVLRGVNAGSKHIGGNGTDLVAIGRLTPAKDYPLMILTISELVHRRALPVHLTIFGEGEERPSLERLVAELKLDESVTFAGFCVDVQNRLPQFDLLLMTSRWEGFGIGLVEALDAGLRIVSTNCPSGPAEILASGKFGALVDNATPESVADSVVARLAARIRGDSNAELAAHLDTFSIAKVGEEYLRLAFHKERTR